MSDISDSSDDDSAQLLVTSSEEKSVSALFRRKETAFRGELESEVAMSRIIQLGTFTSVHNSSTPASAAYFGKRFVTMSSFGEAGRFGNQIIHYVFLKACATLHAIPDIRVPYWIGENAIVLHDSLVECAFPAIVVLDDWCQ